MILSQCCGHYGRSGSLRGGNHTIKFRKIQNILQRIGETFPPKIPHTRAHSCAEYDVEFLVPQAFPGSPAMAGEAQRIAHRTIKSNQNACLLWNSTDEEGWMARDPVAELSSCARLLGSEDPAMHYMIF